MNETVSPIDQTSGNSSADRPLSPVTEATPKEPVAGTKIGQATARASEAVVQSIRKEEPQTLAKMALAAVTPQIIGGVLRFAVRNPGTALACVAVLAVAWTIKDRQDPATDPQEPEAALTV